MAVVYVGYDKITHTKVISNIWEYSDINITTSDWQERSRLSTVYKPLCLLVKIKIEKHEMLIIPQEKCVHLTTVGTVGQS